MCIRDRPGVGSGGEHAVPRRGGDQRLLVTHVRIEGAPVDELAEAGLELGARTEEQVRSERVHGDEEREPGWLGERGRGEQDECESECAGHREAAECTLCLLY